MELQTLTVADQWRGRAIDRPVNHDLATYSTPRMGDPMSLVESIQHLPNHGGEDELGLYFKVRSRIPFNYLGELYYSYFARVGDYNLVDVNGDGVLLEFIGMAACSVVERDQEPFPAYCGVARQYASENPETLEEDELDMDLEDELCDNHPCGVINDAVVVLHDFKHTPLTVQYSEVGHEANLLYGAPSTTFSELSDDELTDFNRENFYPIDFWKTITGPDGETYRLLIFPHED